MEPLFFKAENPGEKFLRRRKAFRFNGAAFFQSGKCAPVMDAIIREAIASMEPLFFKAENLPRGTQWPYNHYGASMEPLFFKAENTSCETPKARVNNRLQWSRFFSKRKMIGSPRWIGRASRLQWSRFFSKRKIARGSRLCDSGMGASMEPLFFKAENNPPQDYMARAKALASMEPLFFKAENNFPGNTVPVRRFRFNGAAFFQSGK